MSRVVEVLRFAIKYFLLCLLLSVRLTILKVSLFHQLNSYSPGYPMTFNFASKNFEIVRSQSVIHNAIPPTTASVS